MPLVVLPMSSFINLLDVVYPIGSIYISMNSESPASTVGGTWTQITDRYLKATNDIVGETGGYASNNFNVITGEFYSALLLPSDRYLIETISGGTVENDSREGYMDSQVNSGFSLSLSSSTYNVSKRKSQVALDNNPPYITCCMWYRTA